MLEYKNVVPSAISIISDVKIFYIRYDLGEMDTCKEFNKMAPLCGMVQIPHISLFDDLLSKKRNF